MQCKRQLAVRCADNSMCAPTYRVPEPHGHLPSKQGFSQGVCHRTGEVIGNDNNSPGFYGEHSCRLCSRNKIVVFTYAYFSSSVVPVGSFCCSDLWHISALCRPGVRVKTVYCQNKNYYSSTNVVDIIFCNYYCGTLQICANSLTLWKSC